MIWNERESSYFTQKKEKKVLKMKLVYENKSSSVGESRE